MISSFMSMNVQVRLTSSLGSSALSYVNEFIILLELPLSPCKGDNPTFLRACGEALGVTIRVHLEGLEKWVDRKNLIFSPCVWLREWKSEEMENSFVWLSRKVR